MRPELHKSIDHLKSFGFEVLEPLTRELILSSSGPMIGESVRVLFVDTETTGMAGDDSAEVWEISYATVDVFPLSGGFKINKMASGWRVPEGDIPVEFLHNSKIDLETIKRLSEEHPIDERFVATLRDDLDNCTYANAFNSKFDRFFIDKEAGGTYKAIWTCSLEEIKWGYKGYNYDGRQLSAILRALGFTNKSENHNGMYDVLCLIWLVCTAKLHFDSESRSVIESIPARKLFDHKRVATADVVLGGTNYDNNAKTKALGFTMWDGSTKTWTGKFNEYQIAEVISTIKSNPSLGSIVKVTPSDLSKRFLVSGYN